MEVDGNSFEEIESAYNSMANDDRPKAIIAHTVKGRGTPFMEDDNNWHYRIPTADEVCQAAEILGIPSEQIQLDGRKPISHG
jgi:transketolase